MTGSEGTSEIRGRNLENWPRKEKLSDISQKTDQGVCSFVETLKSSEIRIPPSEEIPISIS
jgi:hypothetical protein